jgi:hypothetical protein
LEKPNLSVLSAQGKREKINMEKSKERKEKERWSEERVDQNVAAGLVVCLLVRPFLWVFSSLRSLEAYYYERGIEAV